MSVKDDGGPAFGEFQNVGDIARSFGGITVRDYFAAKAMQAVIADMFRRGDPKPGDVDTAAAVAYLAADAMLKARKS